MTHFAKTLLGATALAAIVGGPAFAADVGSHSLVDVCG